MGDFKKIWKQLLLNKKEKSEENRKEINKLQQNLTSINEQIGLIQNKLIHQISNGAAFQVKEGSVQIVQNLQDKILSFNTEAKKLEI